MFNFIHGNEQQFKTIVTRVGAGYYANKASGKREKLITFQPEKHQNVTEIGQSWHSRKVKRNKREIKKFAKMTKAK